MMRHEFQSQDLLIARSMAGLNDVFGVLICAFRQSQASLVVKYDAKMLTT